MEEDSAPGRKAPAGRAFRNRAPRKTEAAKAGSSSRARAARFHELRTCKDSDYCGLGVDLARWA